MAVAELGLGLMLASARWITYGDSFVRSGTWKNEGYQRMGIGLAGRKCGIVGLGTIGNYVAERAQAFGMEISYCGPNEKKDSPYIYQPNLLELARSSDFLVVCCPNTGDTQWMIDSNILDALGSEWNLINISRWPIIDEEALIASLEKELIRSVGLDVYANEPEVHQAITSSDRVILSPHIGTQVEDVREKRKHFFIQNLEDFFSGRELVKEAVVLLWSE